jgi:hypothetical protein
LISYLHGRFPISFGDISAGRGDTEKVAHKGMTWWIRFSGDPEQKDMYVADGGAEQGKILDRASGEILSSFGRAGY